MRKIGFGVIGLGTFGKNHVAAYAEHPFAKLVAVCDIKAELAKQTADTYKAKCYVDYREMLENPEVEAVSVVTPDFLHKEPVLACVEKGKHVLCEKPLATTVEEAEEMVEAAEEEGVSLMVDFHNRWNPPFALTKEATLKGELGEPVHAYVRLSDTVYVPTKMLSWAGKSSVLWFLGSHVVDLARWIIDDEAVEVYATNGTKILKGMGIETADYYQYVVRFRNGATAVFENSWVLPESLPTIVDFVAQFTFTKGCVYIDPLQHGAFKKFTQNSWTYPNIIGGPLNIHGRRVGFVNESIAHFVDCIAQKKQPAATGRDGLAVTKILCAIEDSARRGKPVSL